MIPVSYIELNDKGECVAMGGVGLAKNFRKGSLIGLISGASAYEIGILGLPSSMSLELCPIKPNGIARDLFKQGMKAHLFFPPCNSSFSQSTNKTISWATLGIEYAGG